MTEIKPAHDPQAIAEAARLIQRGGLVAFPTETVYGLGANALDAAAVARIFQAKGRPNQDPLIVHVGHKHAVSRVARDLPPLLETLTEIFWPGPLSLILPKHPDVPAQVTAGLDTVAVRMPAHPIALALIRASQTPIAAPSANRFGHISPTRADHVHTDLAGRIDLILDGGPATLGLESTVLDLTADPPTILRPGGITVEALTPFILDIAVAPRLIHQGEEAVKSPGLHSRHYAPGVPVILVSGPREAVLPAIRAEATARQTAGETVGLLLFTEDLPHFEADNFTRQPMGTAASPASVARTLYAALRTLEATAVTVIIAPAPQKTDLNLAIYDRLFRAATEVINV